jgi:hypothetical protein
MLRFQQAQSICKGRNANGGPMTTVPDIQAAIQSLGDDEFDAFSSWFEQYEEERWDRQIARDQGAEPLRSMMEKARADFRAGKATPL